jgi:diguanylate cyclase (GGDEF)-like protein
MSASQLQQSKLVQQSKLATALVKQQLDDERRRSEFLHVRNVRLEALLVDALVRGTEAQRQANHDALTGLPNRLMLMSKLQQALVNALDQQTELAILFVDLDGFKAVNDAFGHSVGDSLLVAVAARIASIIRAGDLACRYGGDEFVALLPNLGDRKAAMEILDKMRKHLSEPYSIGGQRLSISASIGLAIYPLDGEDWVALLKCADRSMYRSKSAAPFRLQAVAKKKDEACSLQRSK